ncbi:MAG: DUF4058 family protein [Anaerolineae bacterium]|nr:DUF4058 family protein [Anaerolineae bacterium]
MNENAQVYLSPFPGMDPYLEAPDIWPDFHDCRAIDYTRPPNPPLSEADTAWVEERLRAVGLRQS